MLERLVEKGRSKSKRVSLGQMQLTFAFDCRLNQIPEEWQQIAVRNGMRIESEVCGSCVGGIDVSVELKK
jgi:hypothetical protein